MFSQKEELFLEDLVLGSQLYRFVEERSVKNPKAWENIMVPPSYDANHPSGKMLDTKLWEALGDDIKLSKALSKQCKTIDDIHLIVGRILSQSKVFAYAKTYHNSYAPELTHNHTLTPDALIAYLADIHQHSKPSKNPTVQPSRPNPWAQAFRNAVAATTLLIPLSIGGYFAARADVEQEVKKQQALAETRYTYMVRAEIENYLPRIKEEVANAFDEYLDKNSDALRDKLIESIAAYVREHPEQLYDPQVGRAILDGISNDKELMNDFGKQMFTDLMNDEALMNDLGQRLRKAIFGR